MRTRLNRFILLLLPVLATGLVSAQDRVPAPSSPLRALDLRGATVFDNEDVLWLLQLRVGAPLPASAEELAKRLVRLYRREGFASVEATAAFDETNGTLRLTVDEGRIDAIDITGAPERLGRRIEAQLAESDIRPGRPYNEEATGQAVTRALGVTQGAFTARSNRIEDRGGKRVLVIAVERTRVALDFSTGTDGREDFYSPVDGFSPAVGFRAVAYDRDGFNYTLVSGSVSWKFGRDDAGFSIGVERPLLSNARAFVGAEIHDLTTSDDRWRISTTEQSLVALTFANSFRDYYRRRGTQLHAGFRPARRHEFLASWRWDRHEPLVNETSYSFFRRDHDFRPNPAVLDADVNALVLGYTIDSRGFDDETLADRYGRHLVDDLFRAERQWRPGWRIDWTSEIAGRWMDGDHEFTRHILNARGVARLGPRQTLAARAIVGWSDGDLPVERLFAVGGIGSVHGYRFKEAAGSGMTLLNAEYGFAITGSANPFGIRPLIFFDAGQVRDPVRGGDDWLTGGGVGLQLGPVRVECGFTLDDIAKSRQIIVRLGRGF